MTSRHIPQLPADVMHTIFDFLEASEDDPLVAQKRWVTLSLVQKEWARLVRRHRRAFILPTTSFVERFAPHAVKLLSDGVQIRELRIEDVSDTNELLLQLLPLIAHTLESVSIPVALVYSREVEDLCKPETCKLVKVHLYGSSTPSYRRQYYRGGLWRKVSTILSVPTLVHLELANVVFGDHVEDFDITPACHIRTLHLRNINILSVEALEHLAAWMVHPVQHLWLTEVYSGDYTLLAPLELCRTFGKELRSLKVDEASLDYLVDNSCLEDFAPLLPVLRSMEIHGADKFACFAEGSGTTCFLELPGSLRHCSIRPVSWRSASAYLARKQDPTYLPNLQASSVLWLYSSEMEKHKAEVDEYNLRRTMAADDEHACAFQLQWADESEE